MVKGSISKEDFEALDVEPAISQVAVYCTIGYRSGQYATALAKKGWRECTIALASSLLVTRM